MDKKDSDPSKTRVHLTIEGIQCKGIDCDKTFIPKKTNQTFCSPICRLNYFADARKLGVKIIEALKSKSENIRKLKKILGEVGIKLTEFQKVKKG